MKKSAFIGSVRKLKFPNSSIILTAAALVFAGCASSKGEVPNTVLPGSVGEDPFRGKTFEGNSNTYEFGSDNTLTVYTSYFDDETQSVKKIEVGKDWYSVDAEKDELYTKVISVIDPKTGRAFSTPNEYEAYLFESMQKQLNDAYSTELSVDEQSKKYIIEFVQKQCQKLAAHTFAEVVSNTYTINLADKMMVLEDNPPLYFSSTHGFYSQDANAAHAIFANLLQFQISARASGGEVDDSTFYLGVVENDTGSSFTSDMYKYVYRKSGSTKTLSVSKIGDVKVSYTTSTKNPSDQNETSVDVENVDDFVSVKPSTVIIKNLHFVKVPAELSKVQDAAIYCSAFKQLSVFKFDQE